MKNNCIHIRRKQCTAYVPNMRSRSKGDNTSFPIIEDEKPGWGRRKEFESYMRRRYEKEGEEGDMIKQK